MSPPSLMERHTDFKKHCCVGRGKRSFPLPNPAPFLSGIGYPLSLRDLSFGVHDSAFDSRQEQLIHHPLSHLQILRAGVSKWQHPG